MQNFTDAVVDRYQSLNPDKDGASIKGPSDLKNEIQIITLRDDLFEFWRNFLSMQADGDLIDPVTRKPFRDAKNYKRVPLKREFFRHGGHFTDTDYGVQAQHLLGLTPNRTTPYPKVSVGKSRILVVDNYCNQDWAERRKRKKVVLQELLDFKPSLAFTTKGGDVIDDKWRSWKARHRFSSSTWDFLLTHPKAEFFKKRLQNDAWGKRAKDLKKEFPEVVFMFHRFMKLKYQLPARGGGVEVCDVDIMSTPSVRNSGHEYLQKEVNLAVLDVREVPRSKPSASESALEPLLNFLERSMEPKMNEPTVWLFILEDNDDMNAINAFVAQKMQEYDCARSRYIPCKAEMLNNVTNRGVALDVPLLFLFKRHSEFATSVRGSMKTEYAAPQATNVYYREAGRNTEAKLRGSPKELRMEFYLDILQAFATPAETVVGLFTGAKFAMAAKVYNVPLWTFYPRLEDNLICVVY